MFVIFRDDNIVPAIYRAKDCPGCRRLRHNCFLSPLTGSPLPSSGKLLTACPYYRGRQKHLVKQISLW